MSPPRKPDPLPILAALLWGAIVVIILAVTTVTMQATR